MSRLHYLPYLSAGLLLLSAPTYGAEPIPENAFMGSMDDEAAQMRVTCKLREGESALDCDFFQLAIYPSDAKQKTRQDVAKAADADLDRFCKVNSESDPEDTPAIKAKISTIKSACTQGDKAKRRESIAAVAADHTPDCTAELNTFSLAFRPALGGKWVSTQTSPCGFTMVSELIPEADKSIKDLVLWSYTQVRVGTVSSDDQFCKGVTLNKPLRYSWRRLGDTYKRACTTFKLNVF